ncbi:hypothetical protein [Egicoccus sp. AB-alg6-2]|uniref:hypothetical protein n=1 Tax=Egicoccus sp. AB-alg6-2 TaxID=3242692 RepID=UPI00359DFC39
MSVHVDRRPDGVYLRADAYLLWLPDERPYAMITDTEGEPWVEVLLPWSVHTAGELDDTLQLHPPEIEQVDNGQRITIGMVSTAWDDKRLVVDLRDTEVQFALVVEGTGLLTDVHLLGGYYSGDRRHGSGFHHSGADFRSICNPEPWGSERRVLAAGESTILDVLGSSVPGKEHWLFTPPPLCLAVAREPVAGDTDDLPDGPILGIGIEAAPERHNFTALHYDAVEGAFSFRLAYEAQTRVDGTFTTPTLSLRFGADDPYEAIARQRAALQERGWVPRATGPKTPPAWWREPIFCGWGSQCVRSSEVGGGPQDHATQANYDHFLAALAANDLRPGTVVLDDKWQRTYGGWEADLDKWPDLRSWIDGRHADGQRVLLWWKAWDPEGLPEAWCVRNRAGEPMGVDPSNPHYEAHLRQTVRRMLGPDGYDADGFKVDFSARTPSGPGLERHGEAWGMELLHLLLWILYDETKRVKPDALVMTHTPHAYFADVTDMIRLNDINTRAPVVSQMVHRARVAEAACPSLLIDTDNWPMPDPQSFHDYLEVQPALGVPSLYYATHLDDLPPWTKGRGHVAIDGFVAARADDGAPGERPAGQPVPMTDRDYAAIRSAWARSRRPQERP